MGLQKISENEAHQILNLKENFIKIKKRDSVCII